MRLLGIPREPRTAWVAALLEVPESLGYGRFTPFCRAFAWFTRAFWNPAQFLSLYPKMVAKTASPVTVAYPIDERFSRSTK